MSIGVSKYKNETEKEVEWITIYKGQNFGIVQERVLVLEEFVHDGENEEKRVLEAYWVQKEDKEK